jgi:hypothetical protein
VTLEGNVEYYRHRLEAERAVSYAPGVTTAVGSFPYWKAPSFSSCTLSSGHTHCLHLR